MKKPLIVVGGIVGFVLAAAGVFGAPADYPPSGLELFYQTIVNGGRTLFQRPTLVLNGGVVCTDDKPNNRTVCNIATPVPSFTPTRTPTATATPTSAPPTATPTLTPTIGPSPTVTPTPAAGQVFLISTSVPQSSCNSSFSLVHSPASAPSLILVDVLYGYSGSAITLSGTPTYGGTPMTLVSGPIVGTSGPQHVAAYVYKLESPPNGAQTVAGAWMTTVSGCTIGVRSYGGTAVSSATGSPVTATGTTSPASVTVSSAANHLVHDAMVDFQSPFILPTAGAGQTKAYQGVLGSLIGQGSNAPGTASVLMTWAVSSVQAWADIGIDITP